MSGTVPGKVKVEEDAAPGSSQEEPDSSMLEGMRSVRMASSRETERTVLTMSRAANMKDMADVEEEGGIVMVVPFVRWSTGMNEQEWNGAMLHGLLWAAFDQRGTYEERTPFFVMARAFPFSFVWISLLFAPG